MNPKRKTRRTPTRPGMGRLPGMERRGYAPRAGSKNNTTLWIIGGSVGGFFLLLLLIAAASSSGGPTYGAGAAGTPTPRPVDVSGLEQNGMAKCEQGYSMIQGCQSMMTGRKLNPSEEKDLKRRLDGGLHLIREGLGMLEEANRKTNYRNKYDTTRFTKAQRAASLKLGELGGR